MGGIDTTRRGGRLREGIQQMSEAQAIIEKSGFEVSEVRDFMHNLRDSGRTNMYGSGEYLEREFGFDRREQKTIVLSYMDDGIGEDDE